MFFINIEPLYLVLDATSTFECINRLDQLHRLHIDSEVNDSTEKNQ